MNSPIQKQIKVFFSYSHIDEKLRDKLEEHLSLLRRNGVISEWHDRKITGGSNISDEISKNLNDADIILLLVSSSFLNSDYCYEKEMTRALERHNAKEARVIPVILRPCAWHSAPFGELLAFPKDGFPVTKWDNEDDAFLDIEKGISRVAKELQTPKSQQQAGESEEKKKIKTRVELPSPVVSFVPRHDREGQDLIEKVRQSLAESENRTVVLWGYGGVGKTTLAAQIARSSENEKQIVWISADGRTEISVGVLLDEIATQLGHPEVRQLPPSLKHEQTLSLLSETPSLIILDNFETLKHEYQNECLDFLKTREFESLITTRERLEGVRNINVFEMFEEEANSFLDRLIEDSTLPNAFTGEIRQKTIEMAERNPLIMQWIVGQIDAAQSPNEVFEELKHGEGDAAERVFNRSFNLPQLGNDGRSVLLALSLFVQSARRKSVREAVGITDNKRFNKALKNLANLRLINVTEGSERLFLGGLTRQFARAYLEKKANYKSYCQKFIRYFENFAQTHSKPTPDNLNHLEKEKDNFSTAIDLAFELKNWQSAFNLSGYISDFLNIRGHWSDLIHNRIKLLNLAKELDNKPQISYFSQSLGNAYSNLGELEKAEYFYYESLEVYRKRDDQSGIAANLGNLGNVANEKGEIEKAEKLYNESLEINRKLGNQSGIAGLLGNLASLEKEKGEIEKAEELYNESLEINRKLGNQFIVSTITATSLNSLANLVKEKGEIEKAEKLYKESLEIKRKLGNQLGIADSLRHLGNLAKDKGEMGNAEQLYIESLEINRKLNSQQGISASFQVLGNLAKDKGEIEKAGFFYNESLEIERKLGDQFGIAFLLNSVGEIYFLSGNIDESERCCRESLEICVKLEHAEAINENRRLLGQIFQLRGNLETAENYYQESLDAFRKIDYQKQIALTLKEFASLAEAKGERSRAVEFLKEALQIFEKLSSPKANEVRSNLEKLENALSKKN